MTIYNNIKYLGSFHFEDDQYKISKLWLNVPCLRYIGKSNKPNQPKGLSDYSYMFSGRKDLKILDLSDWDMTGDCININFHLDGMICGCTNLKEIIINRDKCSDNFIDYLFFYSISCNITITDISKKEEEINDMKKDEVVEEVKIPRLEDLEGITNVRKIKKYKSVPPLDYTKEDNKLSINDIIIIEYCRVYTKNIFELLATKLTKSGPTTFLNKFDSEVRYLLKVVKIVEIIDDDNIIVEDLSSYDKIYDNKFIISKTDIHPRILNTTRMINSTEELLDLLSSIGTNMNIEVVNFVKDTPIITDILNIACRCNNEDIYINCDCKSFGDYIYSDDLINAIKVNEIGVSTLIKFEDIAYEILSVEIDDIRNTVVIYSKNIPVFEEE